MWIYQLWRKCKDYIHFAFDILVIHCSYSYVYSFYSDTVSVSVQTQNLFNEKSIMMIIEKELEYTLFKFLGKTLLCSFRIFILNKRYSI